MTQYLLSVHFNEAAALPPEADLQKMHQDVEALNEKIRAAGAWVFAGGLQPQGSAPVVRAEGDSFLLTDGPFIEAKEQIGGFWIIRAADLDAALDWARQATRACRCPIEVRPFQDEPEA